MFHIAVDVLKSKCVKIQYFQVMCRIKYAMIIHSVCMIPGKRNHSIHFKFNIMQGLYLYFFKKQKLCIFKVIHLLVYLPFILFCFVLVCGKNI